MSDSRQELNQREAEARAALRAISLQKVKLTLGEIAAKMKAGLPFEQVKEAHPQLFKHYMP